MGLISRDLLTKRPQELGRIKIGGLGEERKKKSGDGTYQLPVKFDHFVITTMERGPDGNFVKDERIHDEIGDEPTEIRAVLMSDRPEENFHSEMCQYRGRSKDAKVWECDGETATNLKTGTTGRCLKAQGKECECKPYARLHLQLWDSPYTLGYHVFRTTSWESTNNIQTALEEIYARFGTCYNAPVKLVLYPSEDRYDGGVSTSHKVGLVLAMSMKEAAHKIAEAREYLQIASGRVRQIAAGVQEDQRERDQEEAPYIRDEYFPPDETDMHRAEVEEALGSPDLDEGPDHEIVQDDAPEKETDTSDADTSDAAPSDADPELDLDDEQPEPASALEL